MRRSTAFLSVFVAGCAGGAAVETTEHEIVGGQPTTSDPAIALLFGSTGTLLLDGCSATLVSPRVLLAAAHCGEVVQAKFVDTYDSNTYATTGDLGTIAVTKQYIDPAYDSVLTGHDVTFVLLEHPAPARPVPYNHAAVTAGMIGHAMRIVGFGATGPNDTSSTRVKRTVDTTLATFDANEIQSTTPNKGPCSGDSGGATMMTIASVETLIGVTNYSDVGCSSQYGANRIDIRASDLDAFIAANDDTPPGCGMDGTCQTGCLHPDPDCPCAADGMCTTQCANLDSDPDCPKGCGANGVCVSGCPALDPDCPIPVVPCQLPTDCASNEACDFEGNYCTSFCGRAGDAPCPAGRTCGADSTLCELPMTMPPDGGGGCSVGEHGNGNGNGGLALLAAAVVLGLRSRRRT